MEEGSPWFWKWFGPTIVGGAMLLLSILLNTINTNVATVKAEAVGEINAVRKDSSAAMTQLYSEVNELKTQIAAIKEKCIALDAAIKERASYSEANVTAMREKDKDHDNMVAELKEKILRLENDIKNRPQPQEK